MADLVIVPLGPLGTLELPRELYDQHLRPYAAPELAQAPSRWLSAKQLQEATGIPASWFATQARERRITFRKLGRYVRFSLDEVMECETYRRRAVPAGQLCTGSENRNGRASA